METYPIPMVPGPVRVPQTVLAYYLNNYGSGDLENDYLDLYNRSEKNLQTLAATKNKVTIHTGEGMIALWGALKSCLQPGDRVLTLSTGLFGSGIGDMARSIGAEVRTLEFGAENTFADWSGIEKAIQEFNPKMITAVHCETPSGTLNPIARLGELKKQYGVPLLYVDAVASVGGAPVLTDEWGIDLLLGGSQKVISAPPALSFVAVSDPAWEIIKKVNYSGYDALLPFLTAQKDFYFPYTPYWQGLAAFNHAVELLLQEGLEQVFQRHARVADYCRQQLPKLGYTLFPAPSAIQSPTVTAVKVPEGITWPQFDQRLRERGLVVGGNYGALAGKVFRLGHMGTQADMSLLQQALDVLAEAL
ncbi:MAG: aminotransferase class V-fold PLP-dependent enzyme [Anaerolineae bacterium]|nr:aminotransferase class V-fold PLP-dependent enzyme [Anaerolineae bacterium]